MRSYELMTILSPQLDAEAVDEATKKIENLVKKNKGVVEKIDRWGKRRLAYSINHQKEGHYALFYIKGEPATLKELDRVLRISDEVIRFMVVKTPEV